MPYYYSRPPFVKRKNEEVLLTERIERSLGQDSKNSMFESQKRLM
jgi:hypothetical protein